MAAKRNSKGRFVKRGAAPSGTALVLVPRKRRRARRSVPATRTRTRTVRAVPRRKGKRRGAARGASGVTPMKIGIAAVVLGSVAGTATGPAGAKVHELVNKLPGAKTFGPAATAGMYLGATQLIRPGWGGKMSPWLKAAGVIGIVAAGLKVGEAGTAFKWIGDSGGYYGGDIMDVG